MRKLEKYMPIAIDVVEDLFLQDGGTVDSAYEKLAVKFGVSLRMMGMKPTIIAYSDANQGTKREILSAIERIIGLSEANTQNKAVTLYNYVMDRSNDKLLIKRNITEAAIALKLALRLYVVKPDDDTNDENNGNETDQ